VLGRRSGKNNETNPSNKPACSFFLLILPSKENKHDRKTYPNGQNEEEAIVIGDISHC